MTRDEVIAENERRMNARKDKHEVIRLLPIPKKPTQTTREKKWDDDSPEAVWSSTAEDDYSENSKP